MNIKSQEEILNIIKNIEKRPIIIGVTGRVSIGKSTFAGELHDLLEENGYSSNILSTDHFLYSNRDLESKKIEDPRGFPKSYDSDKFRNALLNIKNNKNVEHPVYSHTTYDILDEFQTYEVRDINIVEGVNIFYNNKDEVSFQDFYDLVFFLDTDKENTWNWYLKRVHFHIDECHDENNFFYPFKSMSDEDIERESKKYWDGINDLNDVKFIEPTKSLSDYVVNFDSNHEIISIEKVKK